MKVTITLLYFCFCSVLLYSQSDRIDLLKNDLDSLSLFVPGLEEKMSITVSQSELKEFIRAIANNHDVNVHINERILGTVTNSFNDVLVKDVISFLAQEYNLEVSSIGSILLFDKYLPPVIAKELPNDTIELDYNIRTDLLTINLRNDSIEKFARVFTDKTPFNLVLSPSVRGIKLNVFIKDRVTNEALQKVAYAHNLRLSDEGNGFYMFDTQFSPAANSFPEAERISQSSGQLSVSKSGAELISLIGFDVEISEIIKEAASILDQNYVLYDQIDSRMDILLDNVTFEEMLGFLLHGTDQTYKKDSNRRFLIGNASKDGLRETSLIEIMNRSIEQVVESIPETLKEGLIINVFKELNALIVSGSSAKIADLEGFLRKIDKLVPMVYLEVILLEVNENRTLETGISAGISDEPVTSGGTILSGVDYSLNANSINQIITGFNNLGVLNLGQVTPNFYLTIKAMESNGLINTRSTPKLTALNGQEANLKIGRTEYYVEVRNDFIGAQNPSLSSSIVYQPVEANTSLKIVPFISKDEQITLTIEVIQSDFTERLDEGAPPGQVKREFTSTIRIKNNDMIILGGLDNDVDSELTSGLPWISRVPVLKWIFGNNSRTSSKQRLSILIKPIIIY